MADAPSIDQLIRSIEASDPAASTMIEALESRCLVDGRNRTLFDAAIRAENADVIALLASDAQALAYRAPIDRSLERPVKHTIAQFGIEHPISKIETYLEGSFGTDMAYGRTPLHTACRAGHFETCATLIGAGAKLNAKDVLGLTPLELSMFAHGEAGMHPFIAAFEGSGQRNLPVGARLLREAFAFPAALARLLATAKLDAAARRLLFCYYCARLDADAVTAMLNDGFDINKGVSAKVNPFREACTSHLLWEDDLPDCQELAFHMVKHRGLIGALTTSVDNALINEDGSNLLELMAQAERARKALVAQGNNLTLEPKLERQLIQRRIELLEILFAGGLDFRLARSKLPSDFANELHEMRLGDIARFLKGRSKGPEPSRKKPRITASTFWELGGETVLQTQYRPDEGSAGLIRLVVSNVYGPVDGMSVSVRLSSGSDPSACDWRTLTIATQTLHIDGERVPRAELGESVYGETPWEAAYDLPLGEIESGDAMKVLWIRLEQPQEVEAHTELEPWNFKAG